MNDHALWAVWIAIPYLDEAMIMATTWAVAEIVSRRRTA